MESNPNGNLVVATEQAIAEFSKLVDRFTQAAESEGLPRLVEKLDEVLHTAPAVVAREGIIQYAQARAAAIDSLTDEYFRTAISSHYPELSEDLFKLRRTLSLEKAKKTYQIKQDTAQLTPKATDPAKQDLRQISIPLFAYAQLFTGEPRATLSEFNMTENDQWGNRIRKKVTISAMLPGGAGEGVHRAYRNAMITYFAIVTKALADPKIGDAVAARAQMPVEVGAIWIPPADSLQINVKETVIPMPKKYDPAMILSAFGRKYVVAKWMVDDEEPFERYLKHFTVPKEPPRKT